MSQKQNHQKKQGRNQRPVRQEASAADSGNALRIAGLVLLLASFVVLVSALAAPLAADREAQALNSLASGLAEGRRFAGPNKLESRSFPAFYRRDDNKVLLLIDFAEFGAWGQALVRYSAGGAVEAASGFGLSANAQQRLVLKALVAGQSPTPGSAALAISAALEAGGARVREGLPR